MGGNITESTRCFYLVQPDTNVTQSVLASTVFACIVNVLTALTACIGNSLLVVTIITNTHLHTNGNYILASLATLDLLIGGIVQPLHVIYQVQVVLGTRTCSVAVMYNTIKLVCVVSSVLNALMVSCERCLAVLLPTRYHAVVRTWKMFLLLGMLVMMWTTIVLLQFAGILSYNCVRLIASSIFICVIFVITILYGLMMKVAHRHRIQIANLNVTAQRYASGRRGSLRKESRVFKTAVFVIGAFMLCYIPVSVTWFKDITSNLKPKRSYVIFIYVETLMYVNSTLNVWVYGWRNAEIRQALHKLLRWRSLQKIHPRDTNSYVVKNNVTITNTTLTNTS